ALGINALMSHQNTPELVTSIPEYYRQKGVPFVEFSGVFHHTQDPQWIEKNILPHPAVKERFYYISFGDEIGLPRVDANDEKLREAFRDFLKQRKVEPADIGFASWDDVKPLGQYTAA